MKLSKSIKKIWRLPKKFLTIGAIVIFALGYFLFFRTNNVDKLQFTQVKRQNIRQEVLGSGTVTGKNTANLHFNSNGKLSFINVETGDKVAKGTTIAGLDRENLAINLRQAENTLRDKRASVDKIKDDLKDVTAESYTQRQTRTTAEVAQDNAYEAVLAARKALQDAYIVSPVSGIVIEAPYIAGQTITSSDIIAQIVGTSELYFEAEIDESDIGKVTLGLPAEITVDAYADKVLKGKVSKIVPKTSSTSSGANVVIVTIIIEEGVFNFIDGLTGQVSIIVKEEKFTLTIPQEALREDNTVVVEENKELLPKKVEVGIKSDTDIEVKKGLKEGEKILLNPPVTLRLNFPGGGSSR